MKTKTIFFEKILLVMVLIFPPLIMSSGRPDNDTYWLIRMGEYINQKGIPHFEPLTFHTGLVFNAQQWLSCTIFYHIYRLSGFTGLYILTLLCYLCSVWLIFKLSLSLSGQNKLLSLSIAVFSSIALYPAIHTRPQIFSYLLLLSELYLLEIYIASQNNYKKKFLCGVGLAAISLLWINLHAALWLMFFIVALPYLVDGLDIKGMSFFKKVPKTQGYGIRGLLIILLICFLAGLLNPYGIESMFYIFKSYGNIIINTNISEMKSPDFKDALGITVFLIYLFLSLGYCFIKGQVRWRYILLTVGLAYLGLSSIRNLPLFVITAFPTFAFYTQDVKVKESSSAGGQIKYWRVVAALFILLMGISFLVVLKQQQPDLTKEYTPRGAVAYLKENIDFSHMRLFNEYNTGGYLELNHIKTFIDSRAEVYTKKFNQKADILSDYYNLYKGKAYYKDILAKYGITHALVLKGLLVQTMLARDPDYKLLYEDELFAVYGVIKRQ